MNNIAPGAALVTYPPGVNQGVNSAIMRSMDSRDINALPLAQPLTPREQEILNCIGDGLTNRQMAERLTIAAGTVKWYVRQVYNKLGVSSRAEAVTRARGLGLLPAEDQEGTVRHNLLAAATPFVGREAELDALAELIADPQVRIITLTGPGGIGKTRLALETAGRQIHRHTLFPDGIFFVSLAPLESAEEIVSAVAAALDFLFQGSGEETEQLCNYLRNKQILLVMDNFEHILDGRALLSKINEQAAQITLIVTSRERLLLRGEQLFPLDGLETVKSEDSPTVSPAAQLFLHIARRTVPDFQLHEGDAEQLIRICRLVEGMPLGLELAASWVGLLPLSEIAAEIEAGLTLLATLHHDVPQRHQSMQVTLDVSWVKIDPEQQRAFQELTVFRGGFTRTAAVRVAGAALPMLVTLVNKSWLSYERQKDRYHIHELLRQYGAAKLALDGHSERAVRERHSAYFCDYLRDRDTSWTGPRQTEVTAKVQDEIDNIQAAWRWASNAGRSDLISLGLTSLCRFYFWDGRQNEGRQACRLAMEGISRSLAAGRPIDADDLILQSNVLAWKSGFVEDVSQKEKLLSQATEVLNQVVTSGRETKAAEAFIFLQKALVATATDLQETRRLASSALALFRELADRWGEAEGLRLMGQSYLFRGEYDKANVSLISSLNLSQHLDDTQGIAYSSISLGLVARHQGRLGEAEKLHRQSLELFRRLGNRTRELGNLGTLSYTLSWAGNFKAASEAADQALKLAIALGQHPGAWYINPAAKAAIHQGSYSMASTKAAEALRIAQRRGFLTEIGWAFMFLGQIALAEGNHTEAHEFLVESVEHLTGLSHVYQALPLAMLSYVDRAQGNVGLAQDNLVLALRFSLEYRSISPLMYCLPVAAMLAADEGHPERAIELYGAAQQFGHISKSRWFEDVACRELDAVRVSLLPDVASAAEAQGRELDVWETAENLLLELEQRIRR